MRRSLVSVLLLSLACAGGVPTPVGLHDWSIGSRTLRLIDDGHAVVLEDGAVLQTLDLPHLDPDGYARSVQAVDFDFDGELDLQVLNLDESGAYNIFHRFYRFDPATQRFEFCPQPSELHNVVLAKPRLSSTSLGSSMGNSGTTVVLEHRSGCSFDEVGRLEWSVDLDTEKGTATCTAHGETLWEQAITADLTERSCP